MKFGGSVFIFKMNDPHFLSAEKPRWKINTLYLPTTSFSRAGCQTRAEQSTHLPSIP